MKLPSCDFAGLLASVVIISCLCLSSCKKNESTTAVPTPDLSSQMLGQYDVQFVMITNSPAGVTIDPTSVTVSVESNNNQLDAAKLTTAYSYTLISETRKKVEQTEQSKTVWLRQSGADVAVYDADTKVGYWNKGTLALSNYVVGSSTFTITAVKR